MGFGDYIMMQGFRGGDRLGDSKAMCSTFGATYRVSAIRTDVETRLSDKLAWGSSLYRS